MRDGRAYFWHLGSCFCHFSKTALRNDLHRVGRPKRRVIDRKDAASCPECPQKNRHFLKNGAPRFPVFWPGPWEGRKNLNPGLQKPLVPGFTRKTHSVWGAFHPPSSPAFPRVLVVPSCQGRFAKRRARAAPPRCN